MRKRLDVSSINSEKIKKGEYKSLLPEFYELSSVSEINPWHDDQNVFDHAVAVLEGLEEVLRLEFLSKNRIQKIEKYLSEKKGRYTRKELLYVATILHDIAKSEVLIEIDSGKTMCPGHEIIGSTMVDSFSERFQLDDPGKDQVKTLTLFHGFVSDIITLVVKKNNSKQFLSYYYKTVADAALELLLFIYADMIGSDLLQLNPDDYEAREKLIISWLKDAADKL